MLSYSFRGETPKEAFFMAERWKTALCALVLALTLALAWAQETAWSHQAGPGQATAPAGAEWVLPVGQR